MIANKTIQGKLVSTRYEEKIASRHIFHLNAKRFVCEEILYVSSNKHQSGYKNNHRENKGKSILPHQTTMQANMRLIPGAEEAGRIEVDLTDLIKAGGFPDTTTENSEGKSYTYYEITYDLWIIIEGRTLTFEARSPENENEVQASRHFCVAAGFVPGTA